MIPPVIRLDTGDPVPRYRGAAILGAAREFKTDPLLLLRTLTEQREPVIEFHLPFLDVALVTDVDLMQQILVKEASHFRKADRDFRIMSRFLGRGLITNNDIAFHKIQRSRVGRCFAPSQLDVYAEIIASETLRYIDDWKDGDERDIGQEMHRLTMSIITKTLFGIEAGATSKQAGEIARSIDVLQRVIYERFSQPIQVPEWVPTPNNLRVRKHLPTLHGAVRQLIDARRSSGADGPGEGGVLSVLLRSDDHDRGQMGPEQIMDEMVTLFVAGHETVSTSLMWTFHLLSVNPQWKIRLHQELDEALDPRPPWAIDGLTLTDMIVKESLRVMPPAWILNFRQAERQIDVGGFRFPEDKTVLVSPYAMHHDPRYFPEPEVFDPTRFARDSSGRAERGAFIPFGAGTRICIGQSFAMLEARLILALISARFDVTVAADQRLVLDHRITLGSKHGMRVNLKERHPRSLESSDSGAPLRTLQRSWLPEPRCVERRG